MGLRARWTLVLVAVALVLVVGLGVGLESARSDVAAEVVATWESERRTLVHAALNDHAAALTAVLEDPLVTVELDQLLADGIPRDGGVARVLDDWAARCARNTLADEVLLFDGSGRLLSSAPWVEGIQRVHPRAEDLLGAVSGPTLVFDARTEADAPSTRWVAGVVRRLRVPGADVRLLVGRVLGEDVLADVARSMQIDALRWGAPAPSRGEVRLPLPPGWQPGFGAHLVWDPGAPSALAAIDALRWQIALAGLVAIALAGLVAPWIAAGLGRPLVEMAAAVAAIGRGTRRLDLPERGPREIRALRDALVQMTRALGRAEERIRHAERREAWRDVARGVAHEMRNVLTPLRLAVDNVETAATRDDETARVALGTSLRTARDQLESLERLVDAFRDEARLPEVSVGVVDVRALVGAAVETAAAKRPSVDFRRETSTAPDSVEGDFEQLRRALVNLLYNAADAGPDGVVDVVAARAEDPDRWWIEVRDRGCGPARDVLARLGTLYVTTKSEGTGLGLPETIRVADGHGGAFGLEAREGGGAVARIELPCVVPKTDDVDTSSPKALRRS